MTYRLLALLLLTTTAAAHPGAPGAAHVEKLLADVLGPGKARVFIRTKVKEIPAPATDTEPTISYLWERWEERIADLPPVLPGYRLPRSMAKKLALSLEESDRPPERRTVDVRTVTLILDARVPLEDLQPLRTLVSETLGLNDLRGDILIVKQAPLYVGKNSDALQAKIIDGLLVAATAAVILLLAFLLFPPNRFRKVSDTHLHHPHEPQTQERLPCLAMLAPHHIRSTVQFLETEPAASSVYLLRTVNLDIAAEVFRLLSSRKRHAVASDLLFEPPKDLKKIDTLEEKILTIASSHEAGEGLLEALLLRSPDPIRREVLSRLYNRAPARVRRLKGRLVSLKDLAAASPGSLRSCLASFSTDDIALSLFETPDGIVQAILDALPEVIADMVRERLKYLVPDTYEQVHRSRAEIYSRWKRLELYGRVRPIRPSAART